jgi:hypothetical protein
MRNRDDPRRVKHRHPLQAVLIAASDLVGPLVPERFRETQTERRPLLAVQDEDGTLRPHTIRKQRGE